MKILVTGVAGQLGSAVAAVLTQRKITWLGVDKAEFDIADRTAAHDFITRYRPDAVIHCAAYTAVDNAEQDKEACYAVNVAGTKNIAAACQAIGAAMMYISTDYVFPGEGEQYYEVDDKTGPLNIYGQTKLAGENAVKSILDKYYIVRVSWIFGDNGNNFVKAMLRLGKECEEVNVVCDQVGSPTYTADLAPLLCDMIATGCFGTYHMTNEGVCSWAEFAEEIFRQANYAVKVNYISASAYATRAVRPLNSRLSKASLDKTNFKRLPCWQDAVSRYLSKY